MNVEPTTSTALPAAWIERLFERFAQAYGTDKVASMFRGQEVYAAKTYWAEELAGLTARELSAGFDATKVAHPTWPPTLFEFRALCRPPLDPEIAFNEAVRGAQARREGLTGEWSHRAIYWAMVDCSAFDVLNHSWSQIKGRWTRMLDARIRDPNLPAVPDAPKQLTDERPPQAEPAKLEAVAARVGALATNDPRAWARRILERHARGETVDEFALAKARESAHIRAEA